MAINEKTEKLPSQDIVISRRTNMIIIHAKLGDIHRVEAARERVKYSDKNELVSAPENAGGVGFLIDDIVNDTIKLKDGTVLTGSQIIEANYALIDATDQKQIAAALAEKEAAALAEKEAAALKKN